ncbi:glycoside hydrolase family 43 protein [Sphingomonadaceae bacterium jetA1]|uniref:glycoside hydrolase family 43 protein n=1 Tax=Facivitalis istanbulensis TaxID=3075838 RepID=UPI00346F6990
MGTAALARGLAGSARIGLLLAAVAAVTLPQGTALARNPIVQTRFTADPAPMVHDGVVYLYTSHDEDDAEGFKMLDWRLYSSIDMANWTDRGAVASLKTFPWARQTNDAWAPQVVERGGKFYLYAPVSVAGWPKNVIAVAVADRPEGPFRDAIGKPLIAPGKDNIDPTVWVDKDGQAYLYWGNPDLWYVKLNRDMISYSGPVTKVQPRLTDYQEGPWFYRRGNHYYMAFASTCCSEGIGYAMSDTPTGPWTYKGPIMDHDTRATGNHPGIIDYKGGSYLFGFSYDLNFAMTPIHHERRSVSVAKFEYNADGTIPNLHWWDRTSAPQIGTLDPYRRVEAETIAWTSRIKRGQDRPYDWAPGVTTAQDDRGVYVTRTLDRSYIKVAGVDFGGTGAKRFTAGVARANDGARIELHLDRADGPLIGTLPVDGAGTGAAWHDQSTSVSGATGVHDLYLVFRSGGGRAAADLDYWRFDR